MGAGPVDPARCVCVVSWPAGQWPARLDRTLRGPELRYPARSAFDSRGSAQAVVQHERGFPRVMEDRTWVVAVVLRPAVPRPAPSVRVSRGLRVDGLPTSPPFCT